MLVLGSLCSAQVSSIVPKGDVAQGSKGVMQTTDKYQFRTLGTADGLHSNSVVCLLTDSRGFLWIGTEGGLNRYDGYEVKARFVEDGHPTFAELFNQSIKSLQEDVEGNIWIGCESNRYFIYDIHTAQFSTDARERLAEQGIQPKGEFRVVTDGKGVLWVVDGEGIHRHDGITGQHDSWHLPKVPMPEVWKQGAAAMSDGLYFYADHAVWHFSNGTGELQQVELPDEMGRGRNERFGLFADADGTLWVYSTTRELLCRYSVGGKRVKEMVGLPRMEGWSQSDAIRDVVDDRMGNIWIATDHEGLFVYNKKTEEIVNLRHQRNMSLSLPSDNATCLQCDGQGTVWVGHMKTGVSYVSNAYRVFQVHARECGDILVMAYGRNGDLWMGTDGNGVFVERKDGTVVKTALPNITVMALLSDGKDGMWVGSYNQGLYHLLTPNQYERYSADDGSFPTNDVWTLAHDNRGNLWTSASIGKTVVFNEKEKKGKVVCAEGEADIHGNDLYFDGKHTMYIASVYGLWIYDLNSRKCRVALGNRKGTQQWLDMMLMEVEYDKRTGMMALCHKRGVTMYDMKRDSLFYIQRKSDIVRGMTMDDRGTLWMCTSRGGMVSITPEVEKERVSFVTRNFLPKVEWMPPFNSGAMVYAPEGDILMGSTEGYVSIRPSAFVSARREEGRLIVTEIAVGDSLLNENSTHIRLGHDAAHVMVKFFAGSLVSAQRTRYAYRLVGRMDDWTVTDRNEVAFYALPSGEYTLQICVCKEDGSMGEPRELQISVAPPFFRTTPMYLVYALVAVLLAVWLWYRMRQRQKERADRQRQVMERQKMEQITEMKLRFFTNISHDLRTPLTLIISPLEQMVKKMEGGVVPDHLLDQLKSMHKNALLLLGEVSSLLDFRRLDVGVETLNVRSNDIIDHLNSILVSFSDYAEERNIRLSFDHDTDSFIMDYDKEKMNKVIYNLFSNALKFTPTGGSIVLGFQRNETMDEGKETVSITVADTGKGIPDSDKANIFTRFYQSSTNEASQTGSGIGLHIASDYVKLHKGSISVSDNVPQGSVFTISLPVVQEGASNGEHDSISKQHTEAEDGEGKTALPTVLVVDDNRDMLSFVSTCMKEDYRVLTATDGGMALDILMKEEVALIISDVMMPEVDGFELCRRVKTDINLSHIPIILLTARTTDMSRIEGLQVGADDYLTKPFNIDVLKLRVEKFLEWERNNHRQFRQKMNIEPSEITITPLDEQFIQKLIKMVEQRMDDPELSVETLSAEVGMSRSTLYKKLMAITGQGPAEFIRTLRIKRGKALLEASQMQVAEIAYAVGFTTAKSFSMNFKAEYGVTPSEYQKKVKSEE